VQLILDAPEFWARLVEISFLNMLLSGDNAVVIALAVRALPGRQRLLGQLGGTVGAVALRLASWASSACCCACRCCDSAAVCS